MKLARKAYMSLLEDLRIKGIPPLGAMGMLQVLQRWLRRNMAVFQNGEAERYGLDRYAQLDLSMYPIQWSDFDAEVEVRQLQRVHSHNSLDGLAMRLRDLIWSGIVLVSEAECPGCQGTWLSYLESPETGLVLSCDQCAWSQTPDGNPWEGRERLRPPTTEKLRQWGVIQ